VKNPFKPNVEWHKHQKPQLWIDILSEAGFGKAKLQYTCPLYGRYLRITYVPEFVSYMLASSFRIQMTRYMIDLLTPIGHRRQGGDL
jgi:hypothetical protein